MVPYSCIASKLIRLFESVSAANRDNPPSTTKIVIADLKSSIDYFGFDNIGLANDFYALNIYEPVLFEDNNRNLIECLNSGMSYIRSIPGDTIPVAFPALLASIDCALDVLLLTAANSPI